MNKCYRWARIVGIAGLALLVLIVVTKAAYPHPLFRIGAPVGLLLIVLSLLLSALAWLGEVAGYVRNRQYGFALLFVVAGILVIVLNLVF